MKAKKIVHISLTILVLLILSLIFYSKFFKKIEFTETKEPLIEKTNDEIYNSNIIKDVMYTSMDADGNQYTITALEGEIDYSNPNILYLTDVKGLIQLKDSDDINITSNYGRYNSNNFDTIFSKNVIINYLDNKIIGDYLDFSLEKNLLMISKNIIYTNLENKLRADALEMNIKTKDTKIFMYEKEKKVNIQSKK
tara:strand:- start:188 stop:772 length:585 start_codon:yes stop_codon:yes gene_type:complete